MYLITANTNTSDTFLSYKTGDKVKTIGYFEFDSEGVTPEQAAELMFAVGNRQGEDREGNTWPSDTRSLSVGDVLYLAEGDENETRSVTILAVAWQGWTVVSQPTNFCQS